MQQAFNFNGVDYLVEVIETTTIKGKRKALIKVLPYYTDIIYVYPGDEAAPMVKAKRKEYPDVADLIKQRDKERKKNNGRIIRYRCPFRSFEFKSAHDCKRHFVEDQPAQKLRRDLRHVQCDGNRVK